MTSYTNQQNNIMAVKSKMSFHNNPMRKKGEREGGRKKEKLNILALETEEQVLMSLKSDVQNLFSNKRVVMVHS